MDVKLVVQDAQRTGGRVVVKVELAFHNGTDRTVELDQRTICEGGSVSNHVFDVRQGERQLDYAGIMVKRGHPGPDGFTKVKPGQTHRVVVDLGGEYRFPAEGGEFSVAFDSFNHFSKDKLQLTSNRATFSLKP